jgi:PAS domain S-box-containing protein
MPHLGASPDADQKRLKLLSLALRVGSFGYFVQDWPSGAVTWAPETYKIWGVESAPGIPSHDWFLSTVHPQDRSPVQRWQLDQSWTEKTVRFRIFRPNGDLRHIRADIERERDSDGTPRLAYGILIDESDQTNTSYALQQSEARFQSLFETSGAGVVITSARAEILFVNKSFATLLGYQPTELLGRSIRELSPPDAVVSTYDMVNNMRAQQQSGRDIEKPYIHRDGTLVWTRLNITRHINVAGDEEFIGVMQDLTARRQAEERLRDSEEMLNIAQSIGKIGHWVWWPDKGIAEYSAELCCILGLPTDAGLGADTRIVDFIHHEDRRTFLTLHSKLPSTRSAQNLEFRIVRKNGAVRNIVGRSMSPERTSQGLRLIGTMQDVTESKAREEALRRESLKAEAANRAKTLFLANMSHELRTPLNAVLGFGQLLAIGTKGKLNAEQQLYIDNVVRGGEHLLRLISDVLDLSRIDSGHFSLALTSVDARDICKGVLANFSHLADERDIRLIANFDDATPSVILADQMRLTQVLTNLVSNAVKYNRDAGAVTVAISPLNSGLVRLPVSDTGQGIPRDRQAEVFQHFNRLGAEAQAVEGTGIGLALSKRLVEEMGGVMGFQSEPDVRTTFWFDLPRSDRPAVARAHIDNADFLAAAQ